MNKNKNKKATIYNNLFYLMFFIFFSMIVFFIAYTLFAVGNDFFVRPIQNLSSTMNFSSQVNTGFDQWGTNYHDTPLIFFDYIFLISFISITIGIFISSYRIKALNYFNWLFGLLYFQMVLLFILSISALYTNWIMDLILVVMPNLDMQLPFTYWIIDNIGIIFLLISSFSFLINIIDFDLNTMFSRKDKELSAIDKDEIL